MKVLSIEFFVKDGDWDWQIEYSGNTHCREIEITGWNSNLKKKVFEGFTNGYARQVSPTTAINFIKHYKIKNNLI